MSFTSTLSVCTRTVLVLVVKLFFFSLLSAHSMESIIQSLIKIIIIGTIAKTSNVEGNRQFYPPPFPYYQNEGYYLPDFAPPYSEPVPVYYREPNAPPPISYQNSNSYTPPQLFQQNDNYNPAQFSNPNLRYSVPQMFQYKPNHYRPYIPEPKINIKTPQVPTELPKAPHKKPYYTTNIIVKEGHPPPFYHDDYTKNYQEDDYNDNYTDDSPTQSEPCLLNSPYRYFESPKRNNPDHDKQTLCNPYFQPNFGSDIYTVKMPITLLPSRFPPRVEQLIERIQNYFSTYTEKETPKPQNETEPTTTIPPVTEGASESDGNITVTPAEVDKKNITAEIVELSLLKKSQSSEETTVAETTEQTMSPDTKEEEVTSTAIPDAHVKEVSQVVVQSTKKTNEMTQSISTESPVLHQEVSEQNFQTTTAQVLQTEENPLGENSSENQILNERDYSDQKTENPQTEKNFTDVTDQSITTEMAKMTVRTEETSSVQPMNNTVFEVTDKNG